MPLIKRVSPVLVVVGALVLGVVVAGSSAARTTTTVGPWSQTNADASLSRSNPAESTLTPSTVRRAIYLRSITARPYNPGLPADCDGGQIIAPVLAGGYNYAIVGGYLTKTNASTGAVAWRRLLDSTHTTEFSDVAVSGAGLVLVGEQDCISQSDPSGGVEAFSASTGAKVWSAFQYNSGPVEEMVISQGYVVAAGNSVGGGADVAAFNISDGSFVWGRETDANCLSSLPVLVVAGLVVHTNCNASDNTVLVANNLATGSQAWSRVGDWQVETANSDKPTKGHHLYVISPSGTVQDLVPQTGATRYTLTGAVSALAVDGQRVYAMCGSRGAQLCAYNQATAVREWRVGQDLTQQCLGPRYQLVASARGVLYLCGGTALNASTGAVITTTLWSGAVRSLAVGNGHIAVVVDPRVLDIYGLRGY